MSLTLSWQPAKESNYFRGYTWSGGSIDRALKEAFDYERDEFDYADIPTLRGLSAGVGDLRSEDEYGEKTGEHLNPFAEMIHAIEQHDSIRLIRSY